MIKPKATWSFTDQPDIFRICRELRESGCPIGTATRADETITLVDRRKVDLRAALYVAKLPESQRFHVFGAWYCLKGDHVAALLNVSPVTVRGYRPSMTGGL